MIIDDLDYLEIGSQRSSIIGGDYAYTNTNTYASYGLAYSSGNAAASGQQTSTQTNNYTNVYVSPYVAFSQASASAIASARTGNNHYYSQSTSQSLFFSSDGSR
jgi:hypothetical protein